MRNNSKNKGVSLIELLVAIAIFAALVAIGAEVSKRYSDSHRAVNRRSAVTDDLGSLTRFITSAWQRRLSQLDTTTAIFPRDTHPAEKSATLTLDSSTNTLVIRSRSSAASDAIRRETFTVGCVSPVVAVASSINQGDIGVHTTVACQRNCPQGQVPAITYTNCPEEDIASTCAVLRFPAAIFAGGETSVGMLGESMCPSMDLPSGLLSVELRGYYVTGSSGSKVEVEEKRLETSKSSQTDQIEIVR